MALKQLYIFSKEFVTCNTAQYKRHSAQQYRLLCWVSSFYCCAESRYAQLNALLRIAINGATTLSKTTPSIMTTRIMMTSITTPSIITLMEMLSARMSLLNKPFMLNVIMPSVIMLNDVLLSVVASHLWLCSVNPVSKTHFCLETAKGKCYKHLTSIKRCWDVRLIYQPFAPFLTLVACAINILRL